MRDVRGESDRRPSDQKATAIASSLSRLSRLACLPLVGLSAYVASAASSNELDVARQALRDGLFEVARAHAAKSGDGADARLVTLESWAAEGKWGAVSNALSRWTDAQGAAFDYYRAVVRGDHAAAARLLAAGGSPTGATQALLHEADSLARAGDAAGAKALWREVCSQSNVSARAFAVAAANLMDPALLRRAQAEAVSAADRRAVTLRLGWALLDDPAASAEGAALIRSVVKDAPDTPGARDALLAVADSELAAERWQAAFALYAEASEIWPDVARTAVVQEGRGWALAHLGRLDEALEAFVRAEQVAETDDARASAALKQGDVLTALGRFDEALVRYRQALKKYPATSAAASISKAVSVREREALGRGLYRAYRFSEAREAFRQVAADDPARASRMRFFEVLCLYGAGEDEKAERLAEELLSDNSNPRVRADVCLWLAKFKYNRRDWKTAGRLFREASESETLASETAADALLWAARAAFADGDDAAAIQLTTRLVARFPSSPARLPALLLQGEALNEQARFDEAVLVFDRVAAAGDVTAEDRARARLLKADALFALGADNPVRYTAALEAYRAILFGGALSPSAKLVVSFKIARALEKLKRSDEAIDQYYTQVVLAYRRERQAHTRLDDEARAAFSKAAFRLADEFEGRGKDRQAVAVLDLVATSDSPAAEEARKRIRRLTEKGGVL